MDRSDGITAADDGGGAGAGGCGDGFGHFQSTFGESRHFEHTHGTIPDDGLGRSNFLAIGVDGLGTDVEPHPAIRGGRNRQRLCGRAWIEFGADDVIDGKKQSEFLLLGFGAEPNASQTKRPSERVASCLEKASSFFSSSGWKRTFSSRRISPSASDLLFDSGTGPTQSEENRTGRPMSSSSFLETARSEHFGSGPPLGRPRWEARTRRPPF